MDNDGFRKYFSKAFEWNGKILDRYDNEILVVYYKDRNNKEPRADTVLYDFPDIKTDDPTTFTPKLHVRDQIKIHPLGNIFTIENIDERTKTCTIKDQDGNILEKSCLDLIPYNEKMDTVIDKFYREKNRKDEEKQERIKAYQEMSIRLKGENIENAKASENKISMSVTYDPNDLYEEYIKNVQHNINVPTYDNKIKAQMVTMFFNTFFEHHNNKRISIKPNTLFIICYSKIKTNFLHGRTYEISRENCPRVYKNIIESIHQDDKSVITCDKLFEIFFKQRTNHMPGQHFHVYINVEQTEK